jgi:hypothetical protein
MNSRTELQDICPTTFNQTWEKYNKLKHLLQSTTLLDFQHVEWSPFSTNIASFPIDIFPCSESKIYISKHTENKMISHVVICKGEIKQINHFDTNYNPADNLQGELDLKIGAFVASSFKKMSCIITVHSIGNTIIKIDLHPDFDYLDREDNQENIKAIKKLYNRREWS